MLSLGVALGFGTVGTYAHWTDTVSVTGTSFTAGVLDLLVNGDADDSVSFTQMNVSNLVPGSTAAGVLTVKNVDSAPLKYDVSSSASNTDGKNLVSYLTVKVTGAATINGTAPAATCGGVALPGTGTTFSSPLVSTRRLLAPGASEYLCIQATLSATAPSAVQGGTTTVTLTFNATSDLS